MSTNRSDYIAPSHDDIAALAHALWEARGGGDGRAEEDWLEAERMLSEAYIDAQTRLKDYSTGVVS